MIVQSTVYYIIAITLGIITLLFFVNGQLKKYDPLSKPTGVVLLAIMGVSAVDKMVIKDTNKGIGKVLGPYIGSIFAYIFLSNISGLIGFEPPTSNYSVTLTLAILTVLLIEATSIKYNGIKGYITGFFEPLAPFVVMNIAGKLATLLSLSLRLFGNVLSGSILMTIIYTFCSVGSSVVPILGRFNFVGVLVAPALHFYFDLFSGAMQSYIFVTLTIAFIGNELPEK